ncbi:MAG TPA: TolC family protein [bacterium]|nr:TolC family protein [bacterium]
MRKAAAYLLLLAVSAAPLAWGEDPAPATSASSVQTTLTLEQAQKEALEHSPVYRSAQDEEREAGWGQLEAVSKGFLPHVSIEGQHFFNNELFGNSTYDYTLLHVQFSNAFPALDFPGIYPNTTLTLTASYDLFDGFSNVHRLDAANNRHEAKKILSDYALLQLEEDIRLKFYTALGARILSEMSDENVKTLEDHLKIVQDQLNNGQATKYDVLRVDVQLSEAKSDQISAHDNVVLAREALARSMGLRDDDRPLPGDLPVIDANSLLKQVSGADFKDSPSLKARQLQALAAADESAASGASLWVPRVSLFGQYQWYNSPAYLATSGGSNYFDYSNGNFQNDYFVGVSATWNILDGGESWAKANEADERARQARDATAAAELQTPYDFDQWKRRLVSSLALYQAKLTDVDKARESARLATLGFKAGTRTTTDVLDAELEEYRASAGVVQAQLSALEALINLELVTGKRLTHE